MLKMEQLAELKVLYPEYSNLTVDGLLKGINRDTLFRVTTFLIGKDLFSNQTTSNNELIKNWFCHENIHFANDLANRIINYEQEANRSLVIIHTISVLKILEFAIGNNEITNKEKLKEQSEVDLLFCLLLLNQIEDYQQTKDKDKTQVLFPKNHPAALLFNYHFATSDIINFEIREYIPCQLIKAFYLFLFLTSTNDGKLLLERFYNHFEIDTFRVYFEQAYPIINAWVERDVASSVDLILENDNNYEKNLNFLRKFAIELTIPTDGLDFKHLRERPLIELNDTTFRIIHPLFIADKIYKGNYFLLNYLNSQGQKVVVDFMSWYTTNFTENYLFRNLITHCFPKYNLCLFDDDYVQKGINASPDCYLKIGNDVLLFENKDILINGNIKASYDFEATIKEIKKKLLLKNEKPIGVGQLVNHIKKLLCENKDFDSDFVNTNTIYPIIVIHYDMFDTAGFNILLNDFFACELEKLKAKGISIENVKPLVVINIDTLICISDGLQSGNLELQSLLKDYCDFVYDANFQIKLRENLYDTFIPFAAFVRSKIINTDSRLWGSEQLFKILLNKTL